MFVGILDAIKVNLTQANESIENINREVYKKLESYSKVTKFVMFQIFNI